MKILRFTAKRILLMIPVLLGVSIVIYFLSNLIPGSPVDAYITETTTPEDIIRLQERFGLDQPIYVRYWNWLVSCLQGDFGFSYRTGTEVAELLVSRIGPTLLLATMALSVSLVISLCLGISAACKPYSPIDYISSGIAFVGSGFPGFFLALLSIYLFSVQLGWLPTSGMATSASNMQLGDILLHTIQPTMVLAISLAGSNIRQTRSAMLEVLNEDYVRVAEAKGMHRRTVIFRHALRNALIPITTQVGLTVLNLVGGAVVTEQIFGWPGIGTLLITSIKFRDYPTIMCITLYITFAVLVVNMVVDIIYGLLDPRVRA